MDPIRYPDFVRDDMEDDERTKSRVFSNIAERFAVELFRLERLAQEFAPLRAELEPFTTEMQKLVVRARDVERASVAAAPRPRPQLVTETEKGAAVIAIGQALQGFGSIEFEFEDTLPFGTTNFHPREPGVGRWTGPGQVSTIDLELSHLVELGARTVTLVFSHALAGPPVEVVKAFVGTTLTPLPQDRIRWPTSMRMEISLGGDDEHRGCLTLITRRTVRAPEPDTRLLGVAVKSVGFSL